VTKKARFKGFKQAQLRVISKAMEPYMRVKKIEVRHHLMNAVEIALQKIAMRRDVLSKDQTPQRIKDFDDFLRRLSPEIFRDLKEMSDVQSLISDELAAARKIIYEARRWEAATGLSELKSNSDTGDKISGSVMNIAGERTAWENLVNKVGTTLFGKSYTESITDEVVSPPTSTALH
jgi:hypothetical protein